MMSSKKILYRFEDNFDRGIQVFRRELKIIKETEKSWRVMTDRGPRWVRKGATRKYADPDPAVALESFRRRKERQIEILQGQIVRAYTVQSMLPDIQPGTIRERQ